MIAPALNGVLLTPSEARALAAQHGLDLTLPAQARALSGPSTFAHVPAVVLDADAGELALLSYEDHAPGTEAGGWFGTAIYFNTGEAGCLTSAVAWMLGSFTLTGDALLKPEA